jgi:hypothetical protein
MCKGTDFREFLTGECPSSALTECPVCFEPIASRTRLFGNLNTVGVLAAGEGDEMAQSALCEDGSALGREWANEGRARAGDEVDIGLHAGGGAQWERLVRPNKRRRAEVQVQVLSARVQQIQQQHEIEIRNLKAAMQQLEERAAGEREKSKAQIAEEVTRTCVQTFMRVRSPRPSNPFSSATAAAAAARLREEDDAAPTAASRQDDKAQLLAVDDLPEHEPRQHNIALVSSNFSSALAEHGESRTPPAPTCDKSEQVDIAGLTADFACQHDRQEEGLIRQALQERVQMEKETGLARIELHFGKPWNVAARGCEEESVSNAEFRHEPRGQLHEAKRDLVPDPSDTGAAEVAQGSEGVAALAALEDVRQRMISANKTKGTKAFAAAARVLGGQFVLMRWKKKSGPKNRDQRLAECWWTATIRVHEEQMYLITRPNGSKRPHALNDTYHSIPSYLAEIKLLTPSENSRLLLNALLSANAIDPKSRDEAILLLELMRVNESDCKGKGGKKRVADADCQQEGSAAKRHKRNDQTVRVAELEQQVQTQNARIEELIRQNEVLRREGCTSKQVAASKGKEMEEAEDVGFAAAEYEDSVEYEQEQMMHVSSLEGDGVKGEGGRGGGGGAGGGREGASGSKGNAAATVTENQYSIESQNSDFLRVRNQNQGVDWFWCKKCSRAFKSKHALEVCVCVGRCVCVCVWVHYVIYICTMYIIIGSGVKRQARRLFYTRTYNNIHRTNVYLDVRAHFLYQNL